MNRYTEEVAADVRQALRKLGRWADRAEVERASGWCSARHVLRDLAGAGEIRRGWRGKARVYADLSVTAEPPQPESASLEREIRAELERGPRTIRELVTLTGGSKSQISGLLPRMAGVTSTPNDGPIRGRRSRAWRIDGQSAPLDPGVGATIDRVFPTRPTWLLHELAEACGVHASSCHRVLIQRLRRHEVRRTLEPCGRGSRRYIWRLA